MLDTVGQSYADQSAVAEGFHSEPSHAVGKLNLCQSLTVDKHFVAQSLQSRAEVNRDKRLAVGKHRFRKHRVLAVENRSLDAACRKRLRAYFEDACGDSDACQFGAVKSALADDFQSRRQLNSRDAAVFKRALAYGGNALRHYNLALNGAENHEQRDGLVFILALGEHEPSRLVSAFGVAYRQFGEVCASVEGGEVDIVD